MFVRNATVDDIAAVVAIEAKTLPERWGSKSYGAHLTSQDFFAVLVEDTRVVGFCLARGIQDEWEIYKIAVEPTFQQQGGATKLLTFFERGRKGQVFLEVRASNVRAQAFYQKNQYQYIGLRKKYYSDGEDAYLFQKILA